MTPRKNWKPLDLSQLAPGWWIAADPSITATGLVIMSVGPLGVIVSSARKIGENPTDGTGWHDTFTRADRLMQESVFKELQTSTAIMHGDIHVVHEAPAVGPTMRPEASILGGMAFRGAIYLAFQAMTDAPRVYTMEEPVTSGNHRSVICGNGRADKKEEHEELKKLFPDIKDAQTYITNEATRDALCIALTAANREWKKNNGSARVGTRKR